MRFFEDTGTMDPGTVPGADPNVGGEGGDIKGQAESNQEPQGGVD